MKEIKSIFFRIIFNLPLGFLFLKILEYMNLQLCLNHIDMKSVLGISCLYSLPIWFWATLYISILLLVGEIVSILGEGLISWLFDFPAFWNKRETNVDDNFEKITPCGETYVSHKMLVTALKSDGGIADFSELHFSLSRLLAGAAWLCLLTLVNKEGWLGFLCIVACVLFTMVVLIVIELFKKKSKLVLLKNWFKNKFTSFFMLLLSLAFILILTFACSDLILLILASILLFASCIYRSVANVINFSAKSADKPKN